MARVNRLRTDGGIFHVTHPCHIGILLLRAGLAVLVTGFCVSCSTEKPHTAQPEPEASRFVALPPLQVPGVDLNDGIQKEEAAAIALAYADRFLNHTGMAHEPVDYGEFWQVYCPTGQWDVKHVYFRIWKDGRAFIGPSEKGFPKQLNQWLERQANQSPANQTNQSPVSPK